jgi:hypothetical protein
MMKGDPQLPQVSEDEAIVPEDKKKKWKKNSSDNMLIMHVYMQQESVISMYSSGRN